MNRPLRVLQVTPTYLPDTGGIETHIHEVGTRLAALPDFDVSVLCTDRQGQRPQREECDGLTVLRCPAWPANRDYFFAPGIYQGVRSGGYDVVHCHGIHSPVPVLAMLAARRAGIPYVVTLHTGGHSSRLRSALRGVQWKAVAPLLRHAAAIVGVSRFELQLFARATGLPPDRFRLIRNGGALPLPDERVHAVPGRIVSSARLERYKGHQHVIRAMPYVREAIPGATLEILGSGPYRADLEELAAAVGVSDCTSIDHVPPGDRVAMARRLRSAQVFAAFSEYEAHPVAVMEALSAGIRVVGYDTAGMTDLVEDGFVTGIDPRSTPRQAAAALVTATRGAGALKRPQLPTWEEAADELASIYRSVTRRGDR